MITTDDFDMVVRISGPIAERVRRDVDAAREAEAGAKGRSAAPLVPYTQAEIEALTLKVTRDVKAKRLKVMGGVKGVDWYVLGLVSSRRDAARRAQVEAAARSKPQPGRRPGRPREAVTNASVIEAILSAHYTTKEKTR